MRPREPYPQQLARFQAQARAAPAAFTCEAMSEMRHHLGQTLREQRKARKIKLVRVGAALDKSEASLSRFESGKTWPNDLDAAVDAYAGELDITPLEIWSAAVEHWQNAERPAQVEREIAGATGSRPQSGGRSATGDRASGQTRRAANG